MTTARDQLAEALSKSLGKGKWKYKGKTGVWRTTNSGDRIFIPDGGGKPLAANKGTTKHAKGGWVKKQLKKLIKKSKALGKKLLHRD
jgi:hypothetical protein